MNKIWYVATQEYQRNVFKKSFIFVLTYVTTSRDREIIPRSMNIDQLKLMHLPLVNAISIAFTDCVFIRKKLVWRKKSCYFFYKSYNLYTFDTPGFPPFSGGFFCT